MMFDKRVRREHKRAFFWMGSWSKWTQHKATCPFCGGTPTVVRVEGADDGNS